MAIIDTNNNQKINIGRTVSVNSGVPTSIDIEITDINKILTIQGDDQEVTTDIIVKENTFAKNYEMEIRQSSIGYFCVKPENANVTVLGDPHSWAQDTIIKLKWLAKNIVICIGGMAE